MSLRRLSSPQLTLITPLCAYVIEHAADQEIFVGGGGGSTNNKKLTTPSDKVFFSSLCVQN